MGGSSPAVTTAAQLQACRLSAVSLPGVRASALGSDGPGCSLGLADGLLPPELADAPHPPGALGLPPSLPSLTS